MPMRPLEEEEVMLDGRNVYFFDDVETLRREWSSVNFESVGELYVLLVPPSFVVIYTNIF